MLRRLLAVTAPYLVAQLNYPRCRLYAVGGWHQQLRPDHGNVSAHLNSAPIKPLPLQERWQDGALAFTCVSLSQ